MKKIFSVCMCFLLALCCLTPAAFAEDLFFNTINDQAYLCDEKTFALYTIGYTAGCNSQSDWNAQLISGVEDGASYGYTYSATVKAGSTLFAQLNCMEDVNLAIIIVAYGENDAELARVEKGNEGNEMVDAELTVPDGARSASMLLYAAPVKNNTDDTIGFALQIDITVDGKEDAAALGSTEEAGGSASGNAEDVAIDENTAEDVAELLKDKDAVAWAMEDQKDEVDSLGEAIEELARGYVKTLIILGAAGVGVIVALVAIIKGAAKKKAAKAAIKAAGKAVEKNAKKTAEKAADETTKKTAVENAGASSSAGIGSAAGGGVGDSYVVTDPATGAQTLYVKDEAGNWVSSDGGSVLDTDRVSDWQKERAQDRAWQDKSNENLKNPTKFEEIDKKEELENQKIEWETFREKTAYKYGMDGSDMAAVYDKALDRQAKAMNDAQHYMNRVENFDTAIKVAEGVKTAADYGVSALGAVTGPAGTAIKDVYAFGTNMGEDVMTAIAEGKDAYDVAQAAAKAVVKSAVGVVQNHATGVAGKAAADVVGGGVTGGVSAYVEGNSVGQGIAKGTASGVASAMVDTGGEMVGALKDGSTLSDLAKDLTSATTDAAGDLVKNTSSKAIEKSFDKTFEDLNPNKD